MHLPVRGKTEQRRGEFPRMMTKSKMVHQEEMEWKMYIVIVEYNSGIKYDGETIWQGGSHGERQIILMCLVNQGRRVAEPTCIIKTRTRCHSGQCSRIAEEVSEVPHM